MLFPIPTYKKGIGNSFNYIIFNRRFKMENLNLVYKERIAQMLRKYDLRPILTYKKESETFDFDKLFYKKYWRISDLSKALGLSQGHLYNLVSRREIPFIKKGKLLYFIPSEIDNWIKEGNI